MNEPTAPNTHETKPAELLFVIVPSAVSCPQSLHTSVNRTLPTTVPCARLVSNCFPFVNVSWFLLALAAAADKASGDRAVLAAVRCIPLYAGVVLSR